MLIIGNLNLISVQSWTYLSLSLEKTLRDIGEANSLLCTLHLNIQLFALLTIVEEDLLCLVLATVVFRM